MKCVRGVVVVGGGGGGTLAPVPHVCKRTKCISDRVESRECSCSFNFDTIPQNQCEKKEKRGKNPYVKAYAHTQPTAISFYIIKYVILNCVVRDFCALAFRSRILSNQQKDNRQHGSVHRVCSSYPSTWSEHCTVPTTDDQNMPFEQAILFYIFSFHFSRDRVHVQAKRAASTFFVVVGSFVQLGPLSPHLLHIKSNCNPLNGSCHALTVCEFVWTGRTGRLAMKCISKRQ